MSRQLTTTGRPTARAVGPLDAGAALRALVPVLRHLAGRRIELTTDLPARLPFARADAADFDRVLLNLVLNARDASRPGGSIALRADVAGVEPDRAGWPADRPPGEYLAVTVADQGCGMTEEVRARMFDLFFTTKGDRGTGLGLAAVRDALAAGRGHIEVESEPGWGTSVRVYWPLEKR
ncbi:MAG: ATP-binding protein [Gemmata sp.]